MTTRTPRSVYGPVPSRRLGRSLGIDLVPFKTCSYDCIYCQLGRTTNKTIELREYVPLDAVLEELTQRLPCEPAPDYIGLAGSGEPTLHARIGELIDAIKTMTSVPVAVLTNGSMLWSPEVRASLAQADLVMPSLDAGDASTFERVNRPHPGIGFAAMVEGLATFAEGFRGKIWLEVFILRGITDQPDRVRDIASIVRRIRPDRVQLNTVARPPAEADALEAVPDALERLRGFFPGVCEVIAESRIVESEDRIASEDAEEAIRALLARRPCTVKGIADGLSMRPNEVVKHLDALCARGIVRSASRENGVFYEEARGD